MSREGIWTLAFSAGTFVLTVIGTWMAVLLAEEHHEGTMKAVLILLGGVSLLLLNAFSVYLNLKDAKRAKNIETVAASKMEELLSLMGKMKQVGGQVALLFCFAGWADDLAKMLELIWHHWNNAGERFVSPFGQLDVQGRSTQVLDLLDERKDFVVLYSYHVGRLKVEVPDFSSPLLRSDQSDKEYAALLACLREHAALLRKAASNVRQSGRMLDSQVASSQR